MMIMKAQLVIACPLLINYATGSDLGGATRLVRRRMGQQNPEMRKLDCKELGGQCAIWQGKVPGTLLAGADPCAAQNLADEIVTEAKKNPKVTDSLRKELIEFAKELCQYEHNTHPDYANKNAARNSLYCQKDVINEELDGLFQKQDSVNDPQLFWNPATKGTVKLGEHPGTKPRLAKAGRGGNTTSTDGGNKGNTTDSTGDQGKVLLQTGGMSVTKKDAEIQTVSLKSSEGSKEDESKGGSKDEGAKGGAKDEGSKGGEKDEGSKGGSKEGGSKDEGKNDSPGSPSNPPTNGTSAEGNGTLIAASTLKKCSNPQIKYGPAFEGRKMQDLTFMPVDKETFPQASALNLQIVTRAMCDLLLNCGFKNEDKTIKDCRQLGETIGQSKGDGAGADKWNAAFGFKTNYAAVKPPEGDKKM